MKLAFQSDRRTFLARVLGAGATASGLLALPALRAWAMGGRDIPQGMQQVEGMVEVNRQRAAVGTPVGFGDRVVTGPASLAVFVLGTSVFMLRDGSHLEVGADAQGGQVRKLSLLAGKMMAVFGRGRRRLQTPTAVAALRGSGAYLEVHSDRTYLCTCYGTAEISGTAVPKVSETVTATHHDAPRWIRQSPGGVRIDPAPMINHTDAELIMLDALAFRQPPFVGNEKSHY